MGSIDIIMPLTFHQEEPIPFFAATTGPEPRQDGSKEPVVLRRRRLPHHVRHVRRPRTHRLQPDEPPLLGLEAGETTSG